MNRYASYSFKDKDPIIDILRTALQDDGIDWRDLEEFSGVATATYASWFVGGAKRPQNATVLATIRVLPPSTQRLIWKRLVNVNAPSWRTVRQAA